MELEFNRDSIEVNWIYDYKLIKVQKFNILDAVVQQESILVIYEDQEFGYPHLACYNLNGSLRFEIQSTDSFGILRFTSQHGIDIPVVGWIKENGEYNDYYFSVNIKSGSLKKYGRAY